MQARDSAMGHNVGAGDSPAAGLQSRRRAETGGLGQARTARRPAGGAFLEQVDDFAIVRLDLDGWPDLTPRQRRLAWHLSLAAAAGRDIYWDQVHRHGLAVRRLMETVYRHRRSLPTSLSRTLTRYVKLLWLNNGFYNTRTRRKFVPAFSPADLRRGVAAALAAGATASDLGVPPGTSLTAYLDELRPTIFDATFEPLLANKNPAPGDDLLGDSAVNFYAGVSLPEVDTWARGGGERYPLNSTVVRRAGHLTEDVWRAGDPDRNIPAGRYAAALRAIQSHLDDAATCATPGQAEVIRRLRTFLGSGDSADWRAFEVSWLAARETPVDTINGFIEGYDDPRGQKGAFEGLVYITDPAATATLEALAASAAYFEARTPWDERFKRRTITTPEATAVNVVMAVGNGGPVCSVGINLPNDPAVRERYGSKSVVLANVLRVFDGAASASALAEFALPEERPAAHRHATRARFLQTAMHEILGHASGATAPELSGSPVDHLREHYNLLEEARAELVALHHFWDPRLLEIGAMDSFDVARVAYQAYVRGALVMLRRIKTGTKMADDHMRATDLIVHFLMDTGSVEMVRRDGRSFYRVADLEVMRAGVARLLTEIQRIKSTGDFAAADRLIRRHALHIDTALRDEVVRRAASIRMPDFHAVVPPRLEPVRDASGRVIDVAVIADEAFDTQMLRLACEGGIQ
ncbi:MAG: peptidase M49 [Acidobacteriota bacterium]